MCYKFILKIINFRYVAYVDDVMKAIKKTEESLRKLKKIRDPNYKVNSDDDKIRYQLSLDVNYLLQSVSKIYTLIKTFIILCPVRECN